MSAAAASSTSQFVALDFPNSNDNVSVGEYIACRTFNFVQAGLCALGAPLSGWGGQTWAVRAKRSEDVLTRRPSGLRAGSMTEHTCKRRNTI